MSETKMKLVLQWWEGNEGIFFREDDHSEFFRTLHALETAKTWEEFKALCPEEVFSEMSQWVINGGEQVYWNGERYEFIDESELDEFLKEIEGHEDYYVNSGNKPFDIFQVDGATEGDFPNHLNYLFQDFPKVFLDEFATPVSSMVSGSWYEFPMDKTAAMQRFLQPLGFEISKEFTELSMRDSDSNE